ncbi:uncharacterized protein LOC127537473 [Acanthochromis polyacanthus]|uniref:uncharacterized protein LOC127537473 n=1 Tax=Acanthochromis polyacanthus TaxID=80966 RepID=UPI0022344663|nr:uncharacterized protein LOC127537473 [Acanthochromis polyacanthus]
MSEVTLEKANRLHGEDCPNILKVLDLVYTLPATSAENERGFSTMKLMKTNRKTRMAGSTLDKIMTIKMCTPSVCDFDPDKAIDNWLGGGQAPRRPGHMEREKKRHRLAVHAQPSATVTSEAEQAERQEAAAEVQQQEQVAGAGQEVEEEEKVEEEVQWQGEDVKEGDDDEGFEEDFDPEMSEEDVLAGLKRLAQFGDDDDSQLI